MSILLPNQALSVYDTVPANLTAFAAESKLWVETQLRRIAGDPEVGKASTAYCTSLAVLATLTACELRTVTHAVKYDASSVSIMESVNHLTSVMKGIASDELLNLTDVSELPGLLHKHTSDCDLYVKYMSNCILGVRGEYVPDIPDEMIEVAVAIHMGVSTILRLIFTHLDTVCGAIDA